MSNINAKYTQSDKIICLTLFLDFVTHEHTNDEKNSNSHSRGKNMKKEMKGKTKITTKY